MRGKDKCDECGKEIDDRIGLYGSSYHLWGLINDWIDVDFCSIECLKNYVNKLKGDRNDRRKNS